MAEPIKLKDFCIETKENKNLYKKLNGINVITVDSSICEVVGDKKEIKPLLEIKKSDKEDEIIITTFGYVGRFTYSGVEFNITYRFGQTVLNRMITKVNNFEIKSLEFEAQNKKKKEQHDSLALLILYMNFIFKLEKLSILGIPKSYQKIEHHTNTLKGQLDINRFIKKDMPFQGKISSNSYEQIYVQEILDVLYSALRTIENNMPNLVNERVFGIKNLIYHHANRRFVDERTIENALYHKSIQNSLYSEFKDIIEIASYIIRYNNTHEYKSNQNFKGLIFDVSLLWESYLYTLLKEQFEDEDWKVIHEDKLDVYKDKFYARNMYPDIVIKNERNKNILVFDAKSKSMNMQGKNQNGAGDVDRTDFFQINTYMSYYQNQGYKVLAGGLLYPMKKFIQSECHANNWLGKSGTKFIVDGIDLSSIDINEAAEQQRKKLIDSEVKFIESIRELI